MDLFRLVSKKEGHIRLESGYHTDQWLELDHTCPLYAAGVVLAIP